MASLRHDAIVRVREPHGEDGGYHYFVMELIRGGNLRQAVEDGRVRPARAMSLALAIGDALAAAHRAGFVHRDVKPDNARPLMEKRIPTWDFTPGPPEDEHLGRVLLGVEAVGGAVFLSDGLDRGTNDAASFFGAGIRASFPFWTRHDISSVRFDLETGIITGSSGAANFDGVMFEGEQGDLARRAKLVRADVGLVVRVGRRISPYVRAALGGLLIWRWEPGGWGSRCTPASTASRSAATGARSSHAHRLRPAPSAPPPPSRGRPGNGAPCARSMTRNGRPSCVLSRLRRRLQATPARSAGAPAGPGDGSASTTW